MVVDANIGTLGMVAVQDVVTKYLTVEKWGINLISLLILDLIK